MIKDLKRAFGKDPEEETLRAHADLMMAKAEYRMSEEDDFGKWWPKIQATATLGRLSLAEQVLCLKTLPKRSLVDAMLGH